MVLNLFALSMSNTIGSLSSDSLSIGIPEMLNRFLLINLCISPMCPDPIFFDR
ncbi:unnamed protein product [Meloidogyne enterolobii]|uniref:Uncharacterized protein n=1 Tax=Meloidogyne enterolobii TaxID=390850 RepID=A0ACB0ZPB6_MELEN